MSNIEWTDRTWNPVTGCTRASEGCDNCYAVRMTKRVASMLDVRLPLTAPKNTAASKYIGLVNEGKNHFNGVVKCHEDELVKPLRRKKHQRVFVCSMSDLFHKEVPFEFIDKVFAVMALTPHITYQVLTKRPERMAEYLNGLAASEGAWRFSQSRGNVTPNPLHRFAMLFRKGGALPNVWLGTSVENQEQAYLRIPHLLKCPAAVRFLSMEPLLGDIKFQSDAYSLGLGAYIVNSRVTNDERCDVTLSEVEYHSCLSNGISWVIVGGESGPNARPMEVEWALSIRGQCKNAGVPFFFKQGSSANWPKYKDFDSFPAELQVREWPR